MRALRFPQGRLARFGVIVLIVIAVLALAAWIASIVLRPHYPSPAEITAKMQAQAALGGGEKVFVAHCAYCHSTGIGPQLAGMALPGAAVAQFVRQGNGTMPAFTPAQINDNDLKLLGDYVTALPAPEKK